jgi:hypothetical protein
MAKTPMLWPAKLARQTRFLGLNPSSGMQSPVALPSRALVDSVSLGCTYEPSEFLFREVIVRAPSYTIVRLSKCLTSIFCLLLGILSLQHICFLDSQNLLVQLRGSHEGSHF